MYISDLTLGFLLGVILGPVVRSALLIGFMMVVAIFGAIFSTKKKSTEIKETL